MAIVNNDKDVAVRRSAPFSGGGLRAAYRSKVDAQCEQYSIIGAHVARKSGIKIIGNFYLMKGTRESYPKG